MSLSLLRHPLVLACLGLFAFLGGFAYDVMFAGIPYQDPTVELQERYDWHAMVAERIQLGGLILLLVALVMGLVRRVASRGE